MENLETKTDIKLNVYQRLAEVRKVATFIQKKRVRDNTGKDKLGYAVVTSSDVLNAVNEAINENGLFLSVSMSSEETISYNFINQYNKECVGYKTKVALIYKWVNIDNPIDCVDNIPWECEAVNNAGDPAKSMGASLTYAEKYFMLKYFNIATDEHDPDLDKKDTSKILSKAEKEQIEKDKKLETEKEQEEILKKQKDFLIKLEGKLIAFKLTQPSLVKYHEYIKANFTDKYKWLLENKEYNNIVEKYQPEPQVNENKAVQRQNLKCMDCKNETEFCICDIDKKAPVLAKPSGSWAI